MKRSAIAWLLVITLAVLAGSCSKGGQEENQTAAGGEGLPVTNDAGEPIEMIPEEELSEFEKLANAHLRPFFDAEGTQTDLAVSPGDHFPIYVHAEFETTHPMSAAEYKLILPEGVSVLASAQSDSIIIAMGKWDRDFMCAFRCFHGPKMWLMRYDCKAEDEFTGGTVETTKGQDLNYLGFTMCDATKTLIRAKSGKAVLRRK